MGQEIMKVAVPIFLLMTALESIYSYFKRPELYRLSDSFSNLLCGVTQMVFEVLIRVGFLFAYTFVYEHARIFTLTDPTYSLIFAVFIVDFATYWAHRSSHTINLLWAAHLVHHESETYNFSTALRLPTFQRLLNFPFFFLPIAFIGLSPEAFVFGNVIVGINGFWSHTQIIPRLKWIEWLIVTPSHHRVHHAMNPEYIDKNFSNVFSGWDYLFGTYAPETSAPLFGITHPIPKTTPIEANLSFFQVLRANMSLEKSILGKLRILFGRPDQLDYSLVHFATKRGSQPDKWIATVYFLFSMISLGGFLKINKVIGQNEFTLPSISLALICLTFATLSTRQFKGVKA